MYWIIPNLTFSKWIIFYMGLISSKLMSPFFFLSICGCFRGKSILRVWGVRSSPVLLCSCTGAHRGTVKMSSFHHLCNQCSTVASWSNTTYHTTLDWPYEWFHHVDYYLALGCKLQTVLGVTVDVVHCSTCACCTEGQTLRLWQCLEV